MRGTIAALLAIIVVLLLLPGLFGMGFGMHGWGMMGGPWGGPGRGPGPWMGQGYGAGWFWIAAIVRLVLFAALIWLGYLAITRLARPERESNALAVLKERYARGEISREQYEEMRRTLS